MKLMKRIILAAACCALSGSVWAQTSATFDWEEHAGPWHTSFGYSETNNGVVMTAAGRAAFTDGNDGAGGANGTAMKASYSQDSVDGSFTMEEGGASTEFVVNSIDIMGDGGNAGVPSGDLAVKGMLGVVEVWSIDPTEDSTFYTYTTATTGDMSQPIDKIVWSAPYDPDNGVLVWNNQLDNLVITTGTVPPPQADATFDWEEADGSWWYNYGYTETDNGIMMTAGGRAAATDGGDGAGGANGAAFKAFYGADELDGSFTMTEGGTGILFSVASIDISGDANNSGQPFGDDLVVKGLLGIEEVWSIDPVEDGTFYTYLSATTGDMSQPIDKIVWSAPYDTNAVPPLQTWGNKIDNLAINKEEAEPPVEGAVTFDWEEHSGDWWYSYPSHTETEEGLTLTSGGRAAAHDGNDGAGGDNGYGFKPYYANDEADGTYTVVEGGDNIQFVVNSIDIAGDANNGGAPFGNLLIRGMLEGVEQWSIDPVEDNTFYTYTAATTGDLSGPIDQIVWSAPYYTNATPPVNLYFNRIDNLTVERYVPDFDWVYQWTLDTFWTPHAIYDWYADTKLKSLDYLNAPAQNDMYWWSGGTNEGSATVIKHRPGLQDLVEGPYANMEYDVNVGGLSWRGIHATNAVRVLAVEEKIEVKYELTLYSSGINRNYRIVDSFFTGNVGTGVRYMGNQYDSYVDDLGFILWQRAVSNDLAVVFDPADELMLAVPPVLTIPLAELGLANPTNGAGGDPLAITYTAMKTPAASSWVCELIISNKTTEAVFSVEQVMNNASVYNNPSYYVMSTADDLSSFLGDGSDSDTVSGNGGLGGYDIDDLSVRIRYAEVVLSGYPAYVASFGLDYGQDAFTLEYDDYDSDGLLNIYEYGWKGEMDNGDIAPAVLPTMVVSNNGTVYYTSVQLKDAHSGIHYSAQATGDLTLGFAEPAWHETDVDDAYDPYYYLITRGLNETDALFFQTVITTNAP